MNKKIIFALVFAMGIALVGLLILQMYWIKEAYQVKEHQFNQTVFKSLEEASLEIQRQEAYGIIWDELGGQDEDSSYLASSFYAIDTVLSYGNSGDTNVRVQQQLLIGEDGSEYFQANYSFGSLDELQQVPPQAGRNNSEPDYSVVRDKINNRKNFVNQVVSRMFSHRPEIEERLPRNQLTHVLDEVLKGNGIDIPYEYAVSKWNTVMAYQSDQFEIKDQVKYYRAKLYPDDFYNVENLMTVYFPHRRGFILKSLGFMGVASSVLTLFILFTFTFTMYVILRQKKLSEIKGDFVSNMTHELKTPISTISLASQMLGDKSIPVEAKNLDRISGIITDESKRLGYQVEKVLQMSVFEKGKLKLKLKEMDLHEIIESVASNFAIQVESKEGLLIPSMHAEHTKVLADKVHVTNVVSNLLDNAVKYSKDKPEIYLETKNKNGYLLVSVKDNGIGINRADQKRIFERFYRVHTGNLHNVKGFGLGLSYVKKIIEEHKGFIKVDSDLGEGTTFTFGLPVIN